MIKTVLRPLLRVPAIARWRDRFDRWRSTRRRRAEGQFIPRAQLARELAALPIRAGDIVFVGSAIKPLGFVEGGAEAVVDLLIDLVVHRHGGTLAMPALTMQGGTMLSHVRSGFITDQAHSPSGAGQITEAFRQRPGVIRSLHPTHSVCALGPRAVWLTQNHHRDPRVCGPETPYGHLVEAEALIVALGLDRFKITNCHSPEDLLPNYPRRVYTLESPHIVPVRDSAGVVHHLPLMVHDPSAFRVRIDQPEGIALNNAVRAWMISRGIVQQWPTGATTSMTMRAHEFHLGLCELLRLGVTIYAEPEELAVLTEMRDGMA